MTEISPLDRSHLPQVLALVNGHLGAMMPGWSLTPDYLWGRMQREPQEDVTDPWVVERRSIVGIVKDRVCAAAHLLRYGEETLWKGTGYIDWILFWPGEHEAGAAVLGECRRQMKAWQVTDERISGSLPGNRSVPYGRVRDARNSYPIFGFVGILGPWRARVRRVPRGPCGNVWSSSSRSWNN